MWKMLDHEVNHGNDADAISLTFTRPAAELPLVPDGMSLADLQAETERARSAILRSIAEELDRLAWLDALLVQVAARRREGRRIG